MWYGAEVLNGGRSEKLLQADATFSHVPGCAGHGAACVLADSFSVLPPSDRRGRRPKTPLWCSARLSLSLSLLRPPLPAAQTGCVPWESGRGRSLHYALRCWELVHKPLTESDTTRFYSKNNGKREKCSCKDPCQPQAVLVWVALSSPRPGPCLLAPAPHRAGLCRPACFWLSFPRSCCPVAGPVTTTV